MKKLIHIVPINRVGGVEVAAQSVDGRIYNNFELNVRYIFQESDLKSNYSLFNPYYTFKAARTISN